MHIYHAIAVLEGLTTDPSVVLNPDDKDAINLGIEALKQIRCVQSGEVINTTVMLPGETKD